MSLALRTPCARPVSSPIGNFACRPSLEQLEERLVLSTSSVQANGTTLVNGQPFMPIGFFDIADDGRSFSQLESDIQQVGAAGFNTMIINASSELSTAQWGQIYQYAASEGVYLIMTPPTANPQQFVETFESEPNALGWYIANDVQGSTNFTDLAATYESYRSWDPNHVTNYSAIMSSLQGVNTGKDVDTFGAESYPIDGGDPIASVETQVSLGVAAAAQYQQSPYAYLQTFNWQTSAGDQAPTFQQYYNMAYQAIVAGAKGIINYTFYDSQNYLPNYTSLWAGLQTMPKQIDSIESFLLNGTRNEVQIGPSAWESTWQYQGNTLVIAVNADPSNAANVSFALPSGVTGTAQAPFADAPGTLTFAGGTLSGAIAPLGVEIYEFTTPPPVANQAPKIVTPAHATLSSTGTTVSLSALCSDDGGAANLTYSWGTVGALPGPVTFSTSPGSGDYNTTAQFTTAGTYTFRVTARDAGGLAISSDVTITVGQQFASFTITPNSATVFDRATQQYQASALDQFGHVFVNEPVFSWSVTGLGSISAGGLYTAPVSGTGSATVSGTSSFGTVTANVTVEAVVETNEQAANQAPKIVTPAQATLSSTGTTVSLSALCSDADGAANLTYSWGTVGALPGPVTFSTSPGSGDYNTTAQLTTAGTYTFRVTARDADGLAISSDVTITVAQQLASLAITPNTATVLDGGTQQYQARALDQFGNVLIDEPVFSWSVTGLGSISAGGLYTAPASGTGTATVKATSSLGTVTANVTVQANDQAAA